jgi:hypothetical protein
LNSVIPGLLISTLEPLGLLSYDPVPPRDAIVNQVYDDYLSGRSRTHFAGGVAEQFIRSLLPWMELQQQEGRPERERRMDRGEIEEVLEQLPLPGQFPEGEGGEAAWMESVRGTLSRLGLFGGDAQDELLDSEGEGDGEE